jgi:hypothetical protein
LAYNLPINNNETTKQNSEQYEDDDDWKNGSYFEGIKFGMHSLLNAFPERSKQTWVLIIFIIIA